MVSHISWRFCSFFFILFSLCSSVCIIFCWSVYTFADSFFHCNFLLSPFSELLILVIILLGLPWWLRQLRICLQCRRPRFNPWVRKIPWRREWLPTPGFLPGEFHGQKSLVGYNPRSCKESDTTEWLTTMRFSECPRSQCLEVAGTLSPGRKRSSVSRPSAIPAHDG